LNQTATRRRLVAILAADVAGYSRLMAADDAATVSALDAARGVFRSAIESNQGRVIDMAGDSVLAVFDAATGAVNTALAVQSELNAATTDVAEERRLRFRIGVHLGEILEKDDGTVYGDGVNIAARLQSLARPGGVTVSDAIRAAVKNRVQAAFVDRGVQAVKNIAEPIRCYELRAGGASDQATGAMPTIFARAAGQSVRRALVLGLLALTVLVAGVAAWLFNQNETAADNAGTEVAGGAPIGAGKPSVAVLPFANLSGDPAKDYFGDGISEDITYALGRFSGIRVISRSAVQEYKGHAVTREQVSRELAVRYVVQGSVRLSGDRLRVSVELSDPVRGTLLWSERFEGEGREVFSMQDRIVRSIAGTLAVKLTRLEEKRAFALPTENLEAYDLVLRARALLAQGERASNRQARELLARALELAPNYADAMVAMAGAEYQRAVFGWIEDPAEAVRRSQAFAKKSLTTDDLGARARARAVLSRTYSFFLEFDRALSEAERAIELNPNDSVAYALRGSVLLWLGRLDDALASLETARAYDPILDSDVRVDLALTYYLLGRYTDALEVCDFSIARNGDWPLSHAVRAATLAQLGKAEAAQAEAAEVRRLSPFFQVETFGTRLVDSELRSRIQEGLRKAGL
jgi:adenylate cyclase